MADLIDRQKTLEKIYQLQPFPIIDKDVYEFYRDVRESIKSMPSAEPKKGKWIKTGNKIEKGLREIWWFECSECGFRLRFPTDRTVFNYCPCCGAKNEVTE